MAANIITNTLVITAAIVRVSATVTPHVVLNQANLFPWQFAVIDLIIVIKNQISTSLLSSSLSSNLDSVVT